MCKNAVEALEAIQNLNPASQPKWNLTDSSPTKGLVWLRQEKKLLQVPFEDVLYVEGLKDYVRVVLKGQVVLTHMNLTQAETQFPSPVFLRIHKSYIVRQASIRVIDGNVIELTDGTKVPLGPNYHEILDHFLK